MAQLKGRVTIAPGVGVVGIEVPERAVAALLHDRNFTAERGANGTIGTYVGVPVTVRKAAGTTVDLG